MDKLKHSVNKSIKNLKKGVQSQEQLLLIVLCFKNNSKLPKTFIKNY